MAGFAGGQKPDNGGADGVPAVNHYLVFAAAFFIGAAEPGNEVFLLWNFLFWD